ncbi:MAG TPA: ABC-F family ATP-binding cassette domain-containing protein [Candidatus Avoscillospira stercorigallinarum]|uniref:ABC-F family ATP-binding cassette domain-containing protein n=1 Tax=Candidatus Avoscillospira stercorigallinarum TaxID=2840708 RepID=A0A9D0Z6R7_9FIRM|nr:ABC-F family ATP-binding cassette domain-containing protein [Candidatus Avoscillospira stercorigallinarum]
MIDLSVKDLVKSFDADDNILDGLTFDVQAGERVGIMGRNGAGKTTLFRILTGEIGYDSGEVIFAPGKKVGLISQIPKYPAGYTVEQVLRTAFAGLEKLKRQLSELEARMGAHPSREVLTQYDALMDRFTTGGGYETEVDLQKVVNGLNIPPEMRQREFTMLSGGEKTRVNLARLLLEKTDILLLDEPTNHLDMKSVEWLEEYILRFKGTVLTISHDRYFLDRIVQRIVELRGGKAEFYTGNYSAYVVEKQARFDLQLKQYEQEQAKLKQLGYTVERMKGWGINNRSLYRRAMSIQHRMERIEKTERPVTEKQLKLRFEEKDFFGDEVFTIRDLGKSFEDKTLFDHVELEVKGGERIALLGDNGTGKSTFLKILLGETLADHGKIKFGPTVKTAYLPQIIHFDHPERTLYDTMLYEKNCTPQVARDRLGAFLFQGEDVFKTVANLSGGEQSRLRLCMLMDEKINLLILDEPTNHLDIASREWIEAAVEDYEGTLLFVSHDRYFVDRFATRIWVLEDGTIKDYPCGYEKYRSILAHEAEKPKAAPVKAEKKEKAKTKGGDKALEKKLRAVERDIEKQEALVAEFEPQIEAAASDYQELTRLLAEKEAAEAQLEALMEQWEQLSLELEA